MKKLFMSKAVILIIGITAIMVSCGPSREAIEHDYQTKTITVECYTNHGIETLSVCTKVPIPGIIDEYDMTLRLGDDKILRNFWGNAVCGGVITYNVLPDEDQNQESIANIENTAPKVINYKVRLPDQHTSITMDNNHPTELTGYIRNDTIIINFKNY